MSLFPLITCVVYLVVLSCMTAPLLINTTIVMTPVGLTGTSIVLLSYIDGLYTLSPLVLFSFLVSLCLFWVLFYFQENNTASTESPQRNFPH